MHRPLVLADHGTASLAPTPDRIIALQTKLEAARRGELPEAELRGLVLLAGDLERQARELREAFARAVHEHETGEPFWWSATFATVVMGDLTPGALRQVRAADRAMTHVVAHLERAADLLYAAADRGEDGAYDAAERTREFADGLTDVSGALLRAAEDETAPDPRALNG